MRERLKHRRVEGGSGSEWFELATDQVDILVKAAIVEHELA